MVQEQVMTELGADDAGGADDSSDIDPGAGLPSGLGTGQDRYLVLEAGPPLGLGTGAGLYLGRELEQGWCWEEEPRTR